MGLTKNLGWLSKYITADSSGQIGIGTNVLNEKLVLSDGKFFLTTSDATVGGKIYGYNDTNPSLYGGGLKFQSRYYNGSAYVFADRMTITSIGNVGIGTTSPTLFSGYRTLALNDVSGAALELKVNDVSGLKIFSDSGQSYLYESRNMPIGFNTNSTERMVITAGGNIEVQSGMLWLKGLTGVNSNVNGIGLWGGDNGGGIYPRGTNGAGTFNIGNTQGNIFLSSSGNVAIGSTSDSGAKLNVNGFAEIGGTLITKTYSGSGAVTTDIPIPGGRVGIFFARGYSSDNGYAFSVMYNVSIKVPGGGGSDVYSSLVSQTGWGKTFSFDNNGGYLRITPIANTQWSGTFIGC